MLTVEMFKSEFDRYKQFWHDLRGDGVNLSLITWHLANGQSDRITLHNAVPGLNRDLGDVVMSGVPIFGVMAQSLSSEKNNGVAGNVWFIHTDGTGIENMRPNVLRPGKSIAYPTYREMSVRISADKQS